MAQDPRELLRKLQQTLTSAAQQRGRGSLPGGPRNVFGGAALLLLGTGAVVVVNNALFNGMRDCFIHNEITKFLVDVNSGRRSPSH